MKPVSKLLTDHPHSMDETYFEHMQVAAGFSCALFQAAFAAMIHAVLPFAFEKTASKTITRLHAKIQARSQPATHDPDQINPALRRNGL